MAGVLRDVEVVRRRSLAPLIMPKRRAAYAAHRCWLGPNPCANCRPFVDDLFTDPDGPSADPPREVFAHKLGEDRMTRKQEFWHDEYPCLNPNERGAAQRAGKHEGSIGFAEAALAGTRPAGAAAQPAGARRRTRRSSTANNVPAKRASTAVRPFSFDDASLGY